MATGEMTVTMAIPLPYICTLLQMNGTVRTESIMHMLMGPVSFFQHK